MSKHTRRASGQRIARRSEAGRIPAVQDERRDSGQIVQGEGGLFAPGQPLRGVPGLAGRDGMPRQWAYRPGYNFTLRPRWTEQTTFEQLRNLAALYDGVQLWIHALLKAAIKARCGILRGEHARLNGRVLPGRRNPTGL